MKLNKTNFIALLTLLFFAITQILAEDLNTYIDKNNPANDPKIEITILSEFLKEQHYKKPDSDEFRQRCLDYFGVDIKQSTNDYFQCINGVTGCYNISLKEEFLFTFGESIFYDPSNPKTPTIKQVKADIRRKDNSLAQQFIAYNKLLFNDDTSATNYFIENKYKYYLLEVVFTFDYEKNEILYKVVVPYIETDKVNVFDNSHLLFYNNPQKGYKKRLLNDIYSERGVSAIEEILNSTYNNWEKFRTDLSRINNGPVEKIIIDQALQDKALFHLIKLISHHQDINRSIEDSQHWAYISLVKFYEKDSQLKERLKQHNYYDMGLTILPTEKRIISDKQNDLLENHYITQSKDSYVNLRKEPNSKSEVIKKLPNQTKLTKFKSNGNWYYIKLIDDTTMGYIHISQLSYLN